MKHFAVCLACLVLLPLVWLDEKRQAKQRQVDQLLTKAVADTLPTRRRVAAFNIKTLHGWQPGWRVKAHCVEEAAEIMSQSPLFHARAS